MGVLLGLAVDSCTSAMPGPRESFLGQPVNESHLLQSFLVQPVDRNAYWNSRALDWSSLEQFRIEDCWSERCRSAWASHHVWWLEHVLKRFCHQTPRQQQPQTQATGPPHAQPACPPDCLRQQPACRIPIQSLQWCVGAISLSKFDLSACEYVIITGHQGTERPGF